MRATNPLRAQINRLLRAFDHRGVRGVMIWFATKLRSKLITSYHRYFGAIARRISGLGRYLTYLVMAPRLIASLPDGISHRTVCDRNFRQLVCDSFCAESYARQAKLERGRWRFLHHLSRVEVDILGN